MTRTEALKIAKPRIHTTDEVREILNRDKTCHRTVIKPQIIITDEHRRVKPYSEMTDCELVFIMANLKQNVGDIVYVREAWYYESHMHGLTDGKPDLPSGNYSHRYVYKQRNPDYPVWCGVGKQGWNSPATMPREAARIFYEIKAQRVERLQDINGVDIAREGINFCWYNGEQERWENEQKIAFRRHWNSRHKNKSEQWEANPWVLVEEFEFVEVEG